MHLEWIKITGGICAYGDAGRPVKVPALLWTRTPLAYGHLPSEHPGLGPRYPITEISHAEATQIAGRLGGRLPRSAEWEWMAAGPGRRRWPWGAAPWQPAFANLRDSLHDTVTPVDTHPAGATPEGMLDVAGNVWEWTASTVMSEGVLIRGGSYAAPPLYAQCTFLNAAPAELRSRGIGMRVVREL
ncbi:SUMF1/EgtB/PvdO family nonheme iron enzyme [Amycolatopsis roodepoortensis]|uniref:formylglycine-generating enzyme family protein n=1 Tax=Amycolatopsis roodepoortensis TaxID=700274 RepID=UPI00214C24BC|nr:SUMF1/EgtB/PvdO family nonheme iron enzyme [Amycolatopsis roodepoortensis]UUV36022.1 SUMF1/EgtB/PvdO family nonheme iron enzyme [Amycolatopsis roodepoortensis]